MEEKNGDMHISLSAAVKVLVHSNETKGRVEWGILSHMWWNTGGFEKWVQYFGVMITLHDRGNTPLLKSKNRRH